MNQPKTSKAEATSRCCVQVRVAGLRWPTFRQCDYKGIIAAPDGKLYCKRHCHEAVKARQDMRLEKYRKEQNQQEHRFNCVRACRGMANPEAELEALNAVAEAADEFCYTASELSKGCRAYAASQDRLKDALSALAALRAKEAQ